MIENVNDFLGDAMVISAGRNGTDKKIPGL